MLKICPPAPPPPPEDIRLMMKIQNPISKIKGSKLNNNSPQGLVSVLYSTDVEMLLFAFISFN